MRGWRQAVLGGFGSESPRDEALIPQGRQRAQRGQCSLTPHHSGQELERREKQTHPTPSCPASPCGCAQSGSTLRPGLVRRWEALWEPALRRLRSGCSSRLQPALALEPSSLRPAPPPGAGQRRRHHPELACPAGPAVPPPAPPGAHLRPKSLRPVKRLLLWRRPSGGGGGPHSGSALPDAPEESAVPAAVSEEAAGGEPPDGVD